MMVRFGARIVFSVNRLLFTASILWAHKS